MSEQNDPNLEHMGMPREGERWGLALSGGGLRATRSQSIGVTTISLMCSESMPPQRPQS